MALSNETQGICIDTNKQPHYSDNNMLNVFTSVDDYDDTDDDDDDDDSEYCYACSSSLTTVRKSLSPAVSAHRSNKSKDEIEEEDGFYHKLNKINEPSGLSLLFNLRDTSMDLHEFYNDVTKRGGYQQVTKDGKWEDVASSLNRMNQVPFTSTQLLQLYALILYPFERTYYYRSSVKLDKIAVTRDISQGSWISNLGSGKVLGGCQSNASIGKRKHDDGLHATQYVFSDVEPPYKKKHDDGFHATQYVFSDLEPPYKKKHDDGLHATQYVFSDVEPPYKKIEFNNAIWKSSPAVAMMDEKKQVFGMPIKVKETRKDPRAPVGSRNCYQMYLKMEGDKLRSILGDTVSGRQLREKLAEAWKHLSSDDKLVYIKASNKDKERYLRELAAYEEHKRQQRNQPQNKTNRAISILDPSFINFTKPPGEIVHERHMISRHSTGKKVVESINSGYTKKDDDYHAALEPDDDYEIGQISNASMVQMAFGLMKNAQPHDPIFDTDWEA